MEKRFHLSFNLINFAKQDRDMEIRKMAYWLLKSEPEVWSWHDQVKARTTNWDGVRNYQASNNMKAMKIGDLAFFYHSGKEKQIVGIVEITKEYHLDPTDITGRFCMVEVKAVKSLSKPVSLQTIKSNAGLQNLALVRQSRLSVMPIDQKSWEIICKLGN